MLTWLKFLAPVLLVIAVYAFGRHEGAATERAAQARADAAASRAVKPLQAKLDQMTTDAAEAEQVRQGQVREIHYEKERIVQAAPVVYGARCVDADGVRLLERAAALANGQADGQPVAAGAAAAGAGATDRP